MGDLGWILLRPIIQNFEKEWPRNDSDYGQVEDSFEVSMKHLCSRKMKGVFFLEMLDCKRSRSILIEEMWYFFMWVVKRKVGLNVCLTVHRCISIEKKNQLDATDCFIALIIRLTFCGHFYAHHQELETICVLLPPMVCDALVAGGWR